MPHLGETVKQLSGRAVGAPDARGDLVASRTARGDRAQDREIDAALAQVGVLGEQEARLVAQEAVGGEHVALDAAREAGARLECLQVVRQSAQHGVRADQVLGAPALEEAAQLGEGEGL